MASWRPGRRLNRSAARRVQQGGCGCGALAFGGKAENSVEKADVSLSSKGVHSLLESKSGPVQRSLEGYLSPLNAFLKGVFDERQTPTGMAQEVFVTHQHGTRVAG